MSFTKITPSADNQSRLDSEMIAVCAALFILGVAFATWASRIPAIRDSAFLIPATLGYALLARGIGSVAMMPGTAWCINRFGARKTAFYTGLLVVATLIPITLVPNWIWLAGVMLLVGGAGGGYNLAVNALGANVEGRAGKSRMSTIHSWFGVGNLFGAVAGSISAGYHISAFTHFTVITVILGIVLFAAFYFIPDDGGDEEAMATGFTLPHGGLIWLGLIIFMAATIEASLTNWVALFFGDHIGASEEIAPLGYTTYAGALLLMRFSGDALKNRFGAKKLLTTGCLVAMAGIIVTIFAPHVWVAMAGIFVVGAGVALTFPLVFSAAGREGAMALASVVIFGSIGEMVSQPVVGLIVEYSSLSGGFLFIGVVLGLSAWLCWKADLLR